MSYLGRFTAPGRRKDVTPLGSEVPTPRPQSLQGKDSALEQEPHYPPDRPHFQPGNFNPTTLHFGFPQNRRMWDSTPTPPPKKAPNQPPRRDWSGADCFREGFREQEIPPTTLQQSVHGLSPYQTATTGWHQTVDYHTQSQGQFTGRGGQSHPNPPTYRGGRPQWTFRDRIAAIRVIQLAYRRYRRDRSKRLRLNAMEIVASQFASDAMEKIIDEYITDEITRIVVTYLHSPDYNIHQECIDVFNNLLAQGLYEITSEVVRETASAIVASKGTALQRDALMELEKWCFGVYREGRPFRLPMAIQRLPCSNLIDTRMSAEGAVEEAIEKLVLEMVRRTVRELAYLYANARVHQQLVDVVVDDYLCEGLDQVVMDVLRDFALPYIAESLEESVVIGELTTMVEAEYDAIVRAEEEKEFQIVVSRTTQKAEEYALLRAICQEFVKIVDDGGITILQRFLTNAALNLILCSAATKVHTSLLQKSYKIRSYPPAVHDALSDLYTSTVLSVLSEETGKMLMQGMEGRSGVTVPRGRIHLREKARLIRFFTKYDPAKVAEVDNILAAYATQEEMLYVALVAKYGPEPQFPALKKVRKFRRRCALKGAVVARSLYQAAFKNKYLHNTSNDS